MTNKTAIANDLLLEALTDRLETAIDVASAAPPKTRVLQRRRWALLQANANDIAALSRSLEILAQE